MASRILFSLCIYALLCGSAQAVSFETADRVVAAFKKLPRPEKDISPFEEWTYNTALYTAADCWMEARPGAKLHPALQAEPISSGVYTAPEASSIEPLCESLATRGFQPVCTHATLWVKGGKPSPDWPLDYLQTTKDFAHMEVEGNIYCYLDAKKLQKQPYMARLTVEWTQKPQATTLQTANGPKQAVVGNVVLQDRFAKGGDGKPYREPRMVIIRD